MTTFDQTNGPRGAEAQADDLAIAQVNALVRERLQRRPYAHCFSKITWDFADGTLSLQGCVPTFYLKQMLNTILRDVEQVQRVLNQVDVVSTTGLSSNGTEHGRHRQ